MTNRKFVCNYCDTPCILIMEGMAPMYDEDGEEYDPMACPYDGAIIKGQWKEVKE